jgi:hypothetical protein
MKLKCKYVGASQAADEIFQVLFEEKRDDIDKPYVLIQRAWLEEDEEESSLIYVETHDLELIGHYPKVDAELTRGHLELRLPARPDGTIEIDFTTSDTNFRKVRRMLGIILQRDFEKEDERNANHTSLGTSLTRRPRR